MKIIGILTKDKCYITDNITNNQYHSTQLSSCIINDKPITPAFKKYWFVIDNIPTKIQQYVNQPPINCRYELIDTFKLLDSNLKHSYTAEEVSSAGGDYYYTFKTISNFYEYKSDPQPPILTDVEFEYETVIELEKIIEPNNELFKLIGGTLFTEKKIKYDFLTELLTPSILLHTQPCKMTAEETYNIIRTHIKNNIDYSVAEITSDYDFCFAVSKRIKLPTPISFSGNRNIGTKRKPKYETLTKDTKSVKLFSMAPKSCQSYNVVEPFSGKDLDELNENIEYYLQHLMSVINEPIHECSVCNGTGVIFTNKL